jgi:hypothetical protein
MGVMDTPKEERPRGVEEAVHHTQSPKAIAASAGGWAGLLDCESFEREVQERRHRLRPATDL